VRLHEVDALAHVNNAVYLDVAAQAMLDALDEVGWGLERLIATDAVPGIVGVDLEYLEAARYGDQLETLTWFAPGADLLVAHHVIARAGSDRPLVRATTRWRAASAAAEPAATVPPDLLAALHPLLAA
jgi:acyl-CoA thioesterase FadM